MPRTEQPAVTFQVRQVHRGFWTFDLYFHAEGCRCEYSVGECHSRREAEKQGRAAARAEMTRGHRRAA